MNTALVQQLYQDILEKSTGVQPTRVDLHVHTPSSYDFECGGKSEDDAYYSLLDEAIENEIKIIAITDHNTFDGVNKIKNLIRANKKYRDLLIVCGIEITCFSKHMIAIFPDSFSVAQQNVFLNEIGISESLRGTEDAIADNYGPAILLDKVGKYGGFGILAHADAEKGFLQGLCSNTKKAEEFSYSGKSLAKIIKNPFLFGIQCNNEYNKSILEGKLQNQDYARDDRNLAFIKCSDCHGLSIDGEYCGKSGHPLGSYFSEFKLSELSFEALKMALLDADMRLCNSEEPDYPFIYGAAIKSPILSADGQYATFRFNPELNCIIGSRGTGKTTILETIQSTIMPNSIKGKYRLRVYNRYSCCVVFIKNRNSIYAVSNEPKLQVDNYTNEKNYADNLRVYVKSEKNHVFKSPKKTDTSFIKNFLTLGYQQRQLYEYSKNPNKILEIVDSFILWQHSVEYDKATNQLKYMEQKLDDTLLAIRHQRTEQGKSFVAYIRDNGLEKQLCKYISLRNKSISRLNTLRSNMIKELNVLLAGKVILETKLTIKDRAWKNDIDSLAYNVRHKYGHSYEYYLKIKKALEKAYVLSQYALSFDFYQLLLEGQYERIKTDYRMDVSNEDLDRILSQVNEDHITACLTDSLKMRYNINTGTVYTENYKDNTQISMGQNAVALLLLILNAAYSMNDNRPLLMDQPEDDLDNSYIYSTLVHEFRASKKKRQMIISTHNPNIPVAADAESVLVLEFNGQCGFLSNVGSIDSKATANCILTIMEGGEEAIKRRMDKYNVRV